VSDDDTNEDDIATAMKRQAASMRPPGGAFQLVVIDGPDQGATFVLDGSHPPRVLVGKSCACHLQLSDAHVSRRHVAIDIADPLRITDQRSTNGTYVNGVGVIEAELRGGETISLGETSIRVEVAPSVSSEPHSSAVKFGRVLGASPEMRRLYPLMARLAKSDVPIVIEGETGTGKEQLSEAMHELSNRSQGPFVVFDCTTVSANLLESELFGHERGAFTGAVGQRKGVFEQADGGTLLIDEIGDLDVTLQSKLLRAIERAEVRRVGGQGWLHVDVRVIAATRRDLDREVQEGRFRDDLFFRLAVGRIEIPPLRRRTGDIRFLAEHFFRSLEVDPIAVPYEVWRKLEAYDWPGNVRELYNAVARHVALGELSLGGSTGMRNEPSGPSLERRDRSSGRVPAGDHDDSGVRSSDSIEDVLARDLPFPRARDLVLGEFERRYVERVLAAHNGNVARAAAASGIARRYFQLIKGRHKT
jgi:transcriptional regulator with GAF, ATPase, and Fis domain